MKIDKQKLVELLVEKTGMELEAVESQLEQLITKIKEAAEKGKALEIKGFGMFYFSQQGDLKFDPSEDLETEVNHKYTGMEPVEIKKPKLPIDEPIAGEEDTGTGKTTAGTGKTAKEEEKDEAEKESVAEDTPGEADSDKKTAGGEKDDTLKEEKDELADDDKKPEPAEAETAGGDEKPGTQDAGDDKTGRPGTKKIEGETAEQPDGPPEKEEEKEAGEKDDTDPFGELGQILGDPDLTDPQSEEEKAQEREESIKSLFPELPDKEKEEKKKEEERKEKAEQEPVKQTREPKADKPGKKGIPIKEGAGKKPGEKRKPKKKSPKKKEKSPVTLIVASIVAALVIIVGLVVAMDTGLFGGPDSAEDVAQVEMDPPDAAADPDPGAAVEDEEAEEVVPEQTEVEPEIEADEPEETGIEEETEEAPLYGLTGSTREIDGNYYSIILHSMGNETRAREMQEQLQDDGYRSVITSVNTEDHGMMWRVGVGQFPTIPEAQDAAEELPQDYRENNFIGLIQ